MSFVEVSYVETILWESFFKFARLFVVVAYEVHSTGDKREITIEDARNMPPNFLFFIYYCTMPQGNQSVVEMRRKRKQEKDVLAYSFLLNFLLPISIIY